MDPIYLQNLEKDELEPLLAVDETVKVSLQMSVHHEPDKYSENHIRLKNLISTAREQLATLGIRKPAISHLMRPAEELVQAGRFLAVDGHGLVIHAAHNFSRIYTLPHKPPAMVSVGSAFQIKSLLDLYRAIKFFILVLSQQTVRFLEATEHQVHPLAIQNIPASLDDALRWEDPEKQLQWHTGTSRTDDGRAAVFHGHGVTTKEYHKERLQRFCQLIDRGLSKFLAVENAPLVLAGVDYLLPLYREVNSYSHLLESGISGNHEQRSDVEIRDDAWEIVQELSRAQFETTVADFHAKAARDLATTDLPAVLGAAFQGRVETLFVPSDEQAWGRFDPGSDVLKQSDIQQAGDDDLSNLAAIYTLLNNGKVYTGAGSELPTEHAVAAILRY